MASERQLSAPEIAELQDRWRTAVGQKVSKSLLKALRVDWPELLGDLPLVSIPAPYPDVLDDLRGLKLSRELLDGISLTFTDLSYSGFEFCSMKKVRLQGSKLSWANFAKSSLLQADLLQVVADHAIFDNCKLAGSMMMTGDYRDSSFRNADLRKCVLNGCDFAGSDFTGIGLRGAERYSVNFPDDFDPSPPSNDYGS